MATYLLGGGDGEGKAVHAGGGGHEGLGLLGVDLGEEPDDDSLALRLEGLSLLHGGDSLIDGTSQRQKTRTAHTDKKLKSGELRVKRRKNVRQNEKKKKEVA